MPRKATPHRPAVAPPEPVGPPWFREICAGYLRALHRRGRRPRTLRAYLSELRACGHWLEDEGISDATAKLAAAAVRGALRWAAIQEPPLIAPARWLRVVTARIAQLQPKPIPRRDLEKVLAAIAEPPTSTDLRWRRSRALFLVILSSGARIEEALLGMTNEELEDLAEAALTQLVESGWRP